MQLTGHKSTPLEGAGEGGFFSAFNVFEKHLDRKHLWQKEEQL